MNAGSLGLLEFSKIWPIRKRITVVLNNIPLASCLSPAASLAQTLLTDVLVCIGYSQKTCSTQGYVQTHKSDPAAVHAVAAAALGRAARRRWHE